MIKLIASDVDGTLVKDGTLDINPEYYEVIRKLIDQGIIFVICSGRSYSSLAKLFAPIKDDLLFIADGGSVVKNSKEIIKVTSLDSDLWKAMHREVKANPELDCFVCTPDQCYAENSESRMYKWLEDSYGFPMNQVDDLQTLEFSDIIKLSVYHPEKCREICEENFIPTWGEKSHITAAGKEWVDCIANGTNKGTAIQFLQEKLGILPEECCVFGDNFNDVEMFAAAGESYCVSNAHPKVKAAASKECNPYWECGVLDILKSFSFL